MDIRTRPHDIITMERVQLAITLSFISRIVTTAADFSPLEVREIISTESMYCPQQMCRKGVPNTSKNTSSEETEFPDDTLSIPCVFCQYKCLCDDRCHEFGDCCPDKALQLKPTVSEYECISFKIKTEVKKVYYFMISKCPTNSNVSNEILYKCERPSKKNPKSMLPVKSKDINGNWVTYRNQFCALCHDIIPAEVTSWKVSIDCSQYLPVSFSNVVTFDDAIAFVSSNRACQFQFMPSPDVPERACMPRPRYIIDLCNVTGNWLDYNKTVEEYCLGYFAPTWVGTNYFSNIFCAICNTGSGQQDCFRPMIPPDKGQSIDIPPLSMLINFNPTEDSEPDVTGSQEDETICNCSQGYIYDNYTDRCRELLCSETLYFNGTGCTSIVENSKGLVFRLSFILKPESAVYINNTERLTVANSLTRNLQQNLGLVVTFLRTDLLFLQYVNKSKIKEIRAKITLISEEAVSSNSFSEKALMAVNNKWPIGLHLRTYEFKGMMDPDVGSESPDSSSLYERGIISVFTDQYNVPQHSMMFEMEVYSLIHEIHNRHKRNNIKSSSFLILHVSSMYNCSQVRYNRSEYNYDNLSMYEVNVSGKIIGFGQYERFGDGSIRLCSDLIETNNIRGCTNNTVLDANQTNKVESSISSKQSLVTLVALSISLVCLIFSLMTYLIFRDLRTLPGKNNMALIVTLIIAQVVYLFGAMGTRDGVLCKTLGVLLHYFWLASFFWMSVCSLHVYLIFRDILRSKGKRSSKRFCCYSIYALTMPGVIVAVTVVCFYVISNGETIGYGQTSCYLPNPLSIGLAFALPLGLIVFTNLIFFIATLRTLRETPRIDSNQEHRYSSLVYIRLSSLTGVTWVLGFIAALVQEEVMWYLFIVFCGGQGVYILFAFVCNQRVYRSYERLFCGKTSSRRKMFFNYRRQFESSGKQTTSTAFRNSYQTSATKQTSFSK